MGYVRHTHDTLAPVVAQSFSYAEVLRKIGLKQTGGSQSNIKKRITKFHLDTSHFLGQGRNRGVNHRGGPEKKTPAQVFVPRDPLSYPEKTFRLKRAMLEAGIPYRCEMCGLSDLWNEKPLDLQIDHKNGKKHDNRKKNLRFLCPNCHSQTGTFGSRNRNAAVAKRHTHLSEGQAG